MSDASVASVDTASADGFETRAATVSPSVHARSTSSSVKLESPALFAGNPTDTSPTCSVSDSASSRPSSKPSLSLRVPGSYHSHFAPSPSRPAWFENRSADPAPMLRGPYSTTVMSADQMVTSATVAAATGAASLSSTVTAAMPAPSATCQANPAATVAVTVPSGSSAASSSVATRSSALRAHGANVTLAGTGVASTAPSSTTDTGTVSAACASPARFSRNTASLPSSA